MEQSKLVDCRRIRKLSRNGLRGSWPDWYREVGLGEVIGRGRHDGFRIAPNDGQPELTVEPRVGLLREDLVYFFPDLLTARRLQISHGGLHVRMTEPLLYGTKVNSRPQ
jgi:hypothetical protein